uniref:Uncharacterized protein n=1 Tax=Myoviridae sp. ctm8X17 TaxID=2825168 RepID=A0A8S5Q9W1_9CAUD|nr:MAG TPA: hypothetical protein [Myoviridae sp. ctm8X17]
MILLRLWNFLTISLNFLYLYKNRGIREKNTRLMRLSA